MDSEMKLLKMNDVWELFELPEGKTKVGRKWVFKKKSNSEEQQVERYKARLVAQGFTLSCGSAYVDTFSPVVRFKSVRTVIAFAAKHGLKLRKMNLTTAFLNDEWKESIYLREAEG